MHTCIKYYISGGTTGYEGIPIYPHIVMCARDSTTMVKVRVLLNLPYIAHRYRASVGSISRSMDSCIYYEVGYHAVPAFPSSASASTARYP